eukprot:GILJ01003767.1.p1 GENE.GILJ01003767.1~~GILJ01003767.1.p1  ORF type:complete len:325 (-),score=32.09 GILJ01003767.1:110-1036(-)
MATTETLLPDAPSSPQIVSVSEVHVPTSGSGQFEFKDGAQYHGDWILEDGARKRHGRGILLRDGERYDGEWCNDSINGFGVYHFVSGATYEGFWKDQKFNGHGLYRNPDGAEYEGEWVDNVMHGQGIYTHRDGSRWRGIFVNGEYSSHEQEKLQLAVEDKKAKVMTDTVSQLLTECAGMLVDDSKMEELDRLLLIPETDTSFADLVEGPFPKLSDFSREKWLSMMNHLKTAKLHVVPRKSDAYTGVRDKLIAVQRKCPGQIVELLHRWQQPRPEGPSGEMMVCSLEWAFCLSKSRKWKLVWIWEGERK